MNAASYVKNENAKLRRLIPPCNLGSVDRRLFYEWIMGSIRIARNIGYIFRMVVMYCQTFKYYATIVYHPMINLFAVILCICKWNTFSSWSRRGKRPRYREASLGRSAVLLFLLDSPLWRHRTRHSNIVENGRKSWNGINSVTWCVIPRHTHVLMQEVTTQLHWNVVRGDNWKDKTPKETK